MNRDQPGAGARRTAAPGRTRLSMDVERVLDVSIRQVIRADFRFDQETPWVVSVRFLVAGGPKFLWRIGRDLLHQGLYSASGLGDVRIWPSHPEERGTAWLRLASGDMAALFELPVPPLARWLERTYELVPADRELSGVDWDPAGAGLLPSPEAQSD